MNCGSTGEMYWRPNDGRDRLTRSVPSDALRVSRARLLVTHASSSTRWRPLIGERDAFRRRLQLPRGPLEKPNAQAALEALQALACNRNGEVEAASGGADRAQVEHTAGTDSSRPGGP